MHVQDRWEARKEVRQYFRSRCWDTTLVVLDFYPESMKLGMGQCQAGSLTGAVASERVSEALEGLLRMVGNHPQSAKAEGGLTATPTGGAGTKVGLSDPVA